MAEKTEIDIGTLTVRVLTPQRRVFEQESVGLELHGPEGVFEILPRHEALLAPLSIGGARVAVKGGGEVLLAVHGGFVEMNGEVALILADAAETVEEIDLARAEEAQRRARERLEAVSNRTDESDIDVDRAKLALLRAMTRLKLKEQFR